MTMNKLLSLNIEIENVLEVTGNRELLILSI